MYESKESTDVNGKENTDEKTNTAYKVNDKLITFFWPKMKTTFPIRKNNAYTRQLVEKCSEDCYSLSNFRDRSFDTYRNTGVFGAAMFPECTDPIKMQVLVKIFMFFFIMDDHSEYDWGDVGRNRERAIDIWSQFEAIFDKLLGKKVCTLDWKPYILGFSTCFDTIFGEYSPIQKKRATSAWKSYARGNIEESKFYTNKEFTSIEDIIRIRMLSIGIYPTIQLLEYTEGIELSDEEHNNEIFEEIIDTICLTIVYVNDFYSFRKELIECKGEFKKCRNLIALFVNLEGLSLQEAVNKLVKMIEDSEEKIHELEEKLMSTQQISENMKHYIKSLNLLVGGNWISHVGLDRYSGKDLEEAQIMSGYFEFDLKETKIVNKTSSESLKKYFEFTDI